MEILNPNEIGARIATMIIEAKNRFIAVSPYVKVLDWRKMNTALERAIEKGVSVELYYRDIKEKEYNYLSSIGVKIFEIPNLHTKLYMNDSTVLIGSMNLYETSDLHSRELGVYYDDKESYDKFYSYYTKYIETVLIGGEITEEVDDLILLSNYLRKEYSDIKINMGSNYLFCKNLVESLQVMINLNTITLKLGKRDPEDELIKSYDVQLSRVNSVDIKAQPPEESYRYMTWKIDITNKSYKEIDTIFNSLRKAFEM